MLVALWLVMRRERAEKYYADDEIRENIVCYDEEGGGQSSLDVVVVDGFANIIMCLCMLKYFLNTNCVTQNNI